MKSALLMPQTASLAFAPIEVALRMICFASLVLVGCTIRDPDKNTTNTPDLNLSATSEYWSSHTDPSDSMEGITTGPATSDPTMLTSTAPDPSENSTEGTEPDGSVGETDSAETQSPQQATEKPTTPTASLEETKPMPTTPPETTPTRPTEQETEEMYQTKEIVDASQIAAQANSYAVSLGFVVDNSLNKSNSGYYCPDYRPISSNEVGISAAKDLVSATKNQLNSRFSEEFSPTLIESIFGLVRVNCTAEYSHTDDMGDWYYIYVFYG